MMKKEEPTFTHITIALEEDINEFVEVEAKKSVRSKRQQLKFIVRDYMRIVKESTDERDN
ncbi:TPA: hypothetical protein ACSTJY_005014 [Serratia fonticola]